MEKPIVDFVVESQNTSFRPRQPLPWLTQKVPTGDGYQLAYEAQLAIDKAMAEEPDLVNMLQPRIIRREVI